MSALHKYLPGLIFLIAGTICLLAFIFAYTFFFDVRTPYASELLPLTSVFFMSIFITCK